MLLTNISFRVPDSTDGLKLNKLVADCQPLDRNSIYCNLLQCTHFADTSIAAEIDSQLVGFISGYLIPHRPDTLFVWQIMVKESARGIGLGRQMLLHLLARLGPDISSLETTVTPSNHASGALFKSMASTLGTTCESSTLFDSEKHFMGQHETEFLYTIGPFNTEEHFERGQKKTS